MSRTLSLAAVAPRTVCEPEVVPPEGISAGRAPADDTGAPDDTDAPPTGDEEPGGEPCVGEPRCLADDSTRFNAMGYSAGGLFATWLTQWRGDVPDASLRDDAQETLPAFFDDHGTDRFAWAIDPGLVAPGCELMP